MRSLSTALSSAIGAAVQRPALLAEIAFSPVSRLTSGPALTWNGYDWTPAPMRVDNLVVGALQVSGTLVLDNSDGAIGATVLAQGVQDRAITLWGYDAAATGASDVVWLASAVGAGAQVEAREVRIALRHGAEFCMAPKVRVTAAAGFTQYLPAGRVLRLNGISYTVQRSRQ